MSFFAGIECDKCGDELSWGFGNKKYCKKYLVERARNQGWKIGKYCTCPACAEKKQSVKNSAETSGRKGDTV
jgi:hypothetical protein